TLSGCIHAITALLYPFSWQHAYVPVLPIHLLEMCCLPTPYIIGILSVCVPELDNLELDEEKENYQQLSPLHLAKNKEKQILDKYRYNTVQDQMVSEAFMRYFVETVGHYKIYMKIFPNGSVHFQKEAFVKEVPSKSIRKFLEVFMESQMFSVLIHEKEMAKMKSIQGTFDKRVEEYAEVTAIMQPTGLAKLGNRVRAFADNSDTQEVGSNDADSTVLAESRADNHPLVSTNSPAVPLTHVQAIFMLLTVQVITDWVLSLPNRG
ncbi:DENN domain-containing protein 2B-like, partial [Saccoglossus kowalevskii]|uniref:Suppression of tumorigenicity 5 protein-like n=1 Tax=Saccoglossus kowalevskii TaxID=10224 RepID=A0ABM0M339_SACKO